ncbi:phage regulatory protein/antirepressor Ant [Mycolicibacterium conceptionense]|uniref:phage regulatory protein/antirepressor Ant n=1 Tax=Mycolicibacterium conceptionense TaxID=451644 RepID=UPI0003187DB9|nr:phage regulatory protein/antirepressor Ant [Mycolicibacterium conceptionense]
MSDIESINHDLVFEGADGEPFTTSLVIATETGNQHKNVLALVRANLADLNDLGNMVAFETRARVEGQHGGGDTEFAVLNEPQSALLITYMRNNEVVRAFKKRLVAGFYAMRQRLAQRPTIDGNSITRMELIEIARNAEVERLALEAENRELAPKAEAYDSFLDATGKYAVGAVAQMLGTSQNKLFRELRNRGVFIAQGSRRNTPYQQYAHHFEVIPHEYERSNGEMGCSYTTYVQPSGIDFIRKKLGLPTIDPLPVGGAS